MRTHLEDDMCTGKIIERERPSVNFRLALNRCVPISVQLIVCILLHFSH